MSLTSQSIAIVDDDSLLLSALDELLRDNGFNVYTFKDSDSLAKSSVQKFDLYLIDLRLANESGLDITRHIYSTGKAPVIMLSGVGDEIDKAIGLEAGADDFVSKPFNPRELVARIRALLRRYHSIQQSNSKEESSGNSGKINFGNHTVDMSLRRLFDGSGREVSLTNAEFRLLEYLISNHDRVIDRPELLNHLGGDLSQYVDRTIDVMILRLRGKIEISPSKPVHLQTRRGKGYVFVLHPDLN